MIISVLTNTTFEFNTEFLRISFVRNDICHIKVVPQIQIL